MVLAEGIDLIHFGFQNFPTLIVTKPDNQERCESGGALKLRSLRPGLAAPQISQRPLVPPNPKEETPEICRKFFGAMFSFNSLNSTSAGIHQHKTGDNSGVKLRNVSKVRTC